MSRDAVRGAWTSMVGRNAQASRDAERWTWVDWCDDADAWSVRASPVTRCGA